MMMWTSKGLLASPLHHIRVGQSRETSSAEREPAHNALLTPHKELLSVFVRVWGAEGHGEVRRRARGPISSFHLSVNVLIISFYTELEFLLDVFWVQLVSEAAEGTHVKDSHFYSEGFFVKETSCLVHWGTLELKSDIYLWGFLLLKLFLF